MYYNPALFIFGNKYVTKNETEEIFTISQSQIIHNKVMNLKDHWKKRNKILYTLGDAYYLDGKSKVSMPNNNKIILYDTFKDEYDQILNYFKIKLNTSNVMYHPNETVYLPAFHIFEVNEIFSRSIASLHIDKQYTFLPDIDECDLNKTLSFTIAINIPKNGAGLYKYPLYKNSDQINKIYPWWFLNFCYKDVDYIPYKIGHIVTHDGHQYHMIAPSIPSTSNEYRITLQGHGIYNKIKNYWYLYW